MSASSNYASPIELWHVDVFTERPYAGNAAGVVLDAENLTATQMQSIARELNLSETAFVLGSARADTDALRLRYFTPMVEIPFCGHATVGSLHVIAQEGRIPRNADITVTTGAGRLLMRVDDHGQVTSRLARASRREVLPEHAARVLGLLGLSASDIVGPIEAWNAGMWSIHVRSSDVARLHALRPEFARIDDSLLDGDESLSGVYVHAVGRVGVTYHARFFCNPRFGISEDPVTGSAAGALGAYLHARGELVRDGQPCTIVQGEALGRRGEVRIRILSEGTGECVELGGVAVVLSRAVVAAPPG